MTIGIYAGSFDPITNGHLDIIKRSFSFCDMLYISIGLNPNKKSFFTEEERLEQIKNVPYIKSKYGKNIIATSFQGLLVNYAKEVGADILIRGIRSVSDFEYEINLANVNKTMAPEIETLFLPTSPELAVVSSSMVKEIAKYGADISKFVSDNVARDINKKFGFVKMADPEN